MEDIKGLVYSKLVEIQDELTKVQSVKSFITTNQALDAAEKIVFKDAAVALGDYSFTLEVYGRAWDKIRHSMQIIFLIKSETGFSNSVDNLHTIASRLRRADFGVETLLKAEVTVGYEYIQLTDKLHYSIIDFSVVEMQSRIN